MKKLILVFFILISLMSKPCFANINCGEGKGIIRNDSIITPNGFIFEIIDIQRAFSDNLTGSWSYNEHTNQLFLFRKVAPYFSELIQKEIDTDIIPSFVLKVKKVKTDKEKQ